MAVTTERPGPYAPTTAINEFVDRYRNRGLTRPINAEVLGRAGVSDSLIPRTLQSLVTLELIDDEGNPTETLENLRRAREPEFQEAQANWIRSVYVDVLSFVDPNASESDVRDAFRLFEPRGQQPRMVALFLGLCRAAGLRTQEGAKEQRPTVPKRRPGAPSAKLPRHKSNPTPPAIHSIGNIPAPIVGLLASLPAAGKGWLKGDREKFLTTFEAVLDFCIPVVTKLEEQGDEIDPLT